MAGFGGAGGFSLGIAGLRRLPLGCEDGGCKHRARARGILVEPGGAAKTATQFCPAGPLRIRKIQVRKMTNGGRTTTH